MTGPVSPRQVANALDAWARRLAGRHRQGEACDGEVRDLHRGAAAIRDLADEVDRLRKSGGL